MGQGIWCPDTGAEGEVRTWSKERDQEEIKNRINESLKIHFRPEFLNRLDDIIIFNRLNHKELLDIVKIQLDILRKVSKNPKLNQRKLANDLNLSIGKVNYVLKELKKIV